MQSTARESQRKGLEELIGGVTSRIKEIDESPNPTVARGAKLHLELDKERLQALLDSWQQGRPTIDGCGSMDRLFRALGFIPTLYSTGAEYARDHWQECKALVGKMGFPDDKLCDKIVTQLALRDSDGVPKPDAILSDSHGCDNDHRYYAQSYGDLFDIPVFFVDVPLNEDDGAHLSSLNYVADQLGDFIGWAESKFPGRIKYDEDRLIEMQEKDANGFKYLREIYQLTKTVPCPVGPRDILARFFTGLMPSHYPNMDKAIEGLRLFRDELAERVTKGTGPYPEERLRLMWAGQSHSLQTINPSRLLLERKVALPLAMVGSTLNYIGLRGAPIGEVSEYGVRLSAMQEEASELNIQYWGGPGKRWVNGVLKGAADIGAHGIIHFNLVGCTPMRGMGSVVAERAERELGIPTLNIEGRYLDPDYLAQERFEETLSAFIDKCFDWAGKPRQ